jgi:leader peptidase (prepilin peptidase) / N-methyltransferase
VSPEICAWSRPLHVLYSVEFFVFGLVFGSFLNVCIYRMPRGISVVRPRSACPSCNTPIAAYDNIPVLSWFILRGRCRHCKARISGRYATVELATASFFLFSYLAAESIPSAIKYCVFSFLLIGLIFTDAETKLLPDLLTKPGIILGILFSLLVPVEGPTGILLSRWGNFDWHIVSLINSFAGAVFGSAFILGTALLYEALRGVEGMGMGDVKLMALIGAFLGIKLTLLVLLLGSILGSVFGITLMLIVWRKRLARRRNRVAEPGPVARARAWYSARLIFRNFEVPFGVFLGSAAIVAAFLGMPLIRWYVGLNS